MGRYLEWFGPVYSIGLELLVFGMWVCFIVNCFIAIRLACNSIVAPRVLIVFVLFFVLLWFVFVWFRFVFVWDSNMGPKRHPRRIL